MSDKTINENGILSSLFKSNETYQDRLNKKLGSYAPVPNDSYSVNGNGKGFDPDLASRDSDEARKRVVGALGMAMGAGSVKSMANRALKTFPIIVSDDVSADTCVMIKRALEEQYAEYINLIISNQVIDISKLEPTSVGGNMAIQALDKLTGPEFGTKRIAAKAADGDLSADDVMKNSAAYALLRKESAIPSTGSAYADSLIKGGIIVENAAEQEAAEKIILSEALSATEAKAIFDNVTGTYLSALNDFIAKAKAATDAISDAYKDGVGGAAEVSAPVESLKNAFLAPSDPMKIVAGIKSEMDKIVKMANGSPDAKDISDQADRIIDTADALGDVILSMKKHSTALTVNVGSNVFKYFKDNINEEDQDIGSAKAMASDLSGLIEKISDKIDYSVGEGRGGSIPGEVDSEPEDEDEDAKSIANLEKMTNLKFDPNKLKVTLNDDKTSIGAVISNNQFLSDRYKKASYLLISNRISGNEFISYCVIRLGIPMSRSTRAQLVTQFKAADVVAGSYDKDGKSDEFGLISKHAADNISHNRLVYDRAMTESFRLTPKQVWLMSGIGASGAVTTGLAGWGIGAAAGASAAALPWIILIPALAGGAAAAGITYGIIRSNWNKHDHSKDVSDVEGWERVEDLINQMDRNRKQLWDLDKEYVASTGYAMNGSGAISYDSEASRKEYGKLAKSLSDEQSRFFDDVSALYKVRPAYVKESDYHMHEAYTDVAASSNKALCESISAGLKGCKDYIVESAMLNEKITNTNIRRSVYTYNVNPTDQDMSLVPEFGSKGLLAYGSVEYDKKDLRDRRYNDPLVMTVKFNSRFNDGRTSDSSLTAVIGILGIITRVPSDEMEYVLKENSEKNKAIKGAFKQDSASKQGNPIVDAIAGAFKDADEDRKNLPNSGDLWDNLEKLSNLAVANKLAGKQMDNVVNAHVVFSMKEITSCKQETGDDYSKDVKLAIKLMRRYSALSVMIADDDLYGDGKLMICDDPDSIGWDVVPYSAFENRSVDDKTTKQLSAIAKLAR